MKYEELSRAALIQLLQEHEAERAGCGNDFRIENAGRTQPAKLPRFGPGAGQQQAAISCDADAERQGLDLTAHGESAYHM